MKIDKYTYSVRWSGENHAFICRCKEFPSLGTHGDTPQKALKEMKEVVKQSIKWLEDLNEPIPQPLGVSNGD